MRRTLQATGIALLLVAVVGADDGATARAEDAARRAEAAAARSEDAARRVESAADRVERLVEKLERTQPDRSGRPEERR